MALHPTEEILNITRKFVGGEGDVTEGPSGIREGIFPGGSQEGGRAISGPYIPPSGGVPEGALPRTGDLSSIMSPRLRRRLPGGASPIARRRAFGQQGLRRRQGTDLIAPLQTGPYIPPTGTAPGDRLGGSLSDRFLDLPGPVGFSQTPQGRAILQRVLGLRGRR